MLTLAGDGAAPGPWWAALTRLTPHTNLVQSDRAHRTHARVQGEATRSPKCSYRRYRPTQGSLEP